MSVLTVDSLYLISKLSAKHFIWSKALEPLMLLAMAVQLSLSAVEFGYQSECPSMSKSPSL